MIIDIHVHVFPLDVINRIEEFTAKDKFLYDICSSPVHKYATVDEMLEEMDRYGIDRALLSGFASSDPGLCREMNDYVLQAAKTYPDRFSAMAAISPLDPGMENEISRCHESGAVGVGELFPWGQGFNLEGPSVDRLAGVCLERKLPLLLHINENVGHHYTGKGDLSIKEAAEFAEHHPDLTIIYAHWGGGLLFYELMPKLRRQLQNVYYDTAAGPFLYDKTIYRVAREIGILHKVLLGTDYPLISPCRYMKEIREAGLTEEEQTMLLGENARNLFFGSQQHMQVD